jgi:HEAT repeat protein
MEDTKTFPIVRRVLLQVSNLLNKKKPLSPSFSSHVKFVNAFIPPNASVALLVKRMDDSELMVRAEATRRLGELGGITHLELLLKALHDEKRFVRAEAARALGKLGEQVPIAPLVKALHDRDGSVRVAAAQALGMLGQRESQRDLTHALSDSWPPVREAAILALGKLREQVPLETFLPALQDEDKFVRAAVLSVLGTLGESVPIEPLVAALGDVQKRVREAAIQALVAQGERIPIEALEIALNNQWPPTREAAAKVLSMLGERVPVKLLETASDDEWPPVRAVAEPALQRRALVFVPNPTDEVVPETTSLNSNQHSTEMGTEVTTNSRDECQTKATKSRFIASVLAPFAPFAQTPLPDWTKQNKIGCILLSAILCAVLFWRYKKRVLPSVGSSSPEDVHRDLDGYSSGEQEAVEYPLVDRSPPSVISSASRILRLPRTLIGNFVTDALEQKGE